jgi:lactoylglutathione lyase
MTLKRLTPNLMVEDVNLTIEFYEEVLGFELGQTVPETGQFVWASMKSGAVEMMFQSRPSLTEEIPALEDREIGGSLTFHIQMEGVEELYAMIKDSVTVLQDLHTTFYGMKEFSILDCNGYILAFAEGV